MTAHTLEQALSTLEEAIHMDGPDSVAVIDSKIADVMAFNDSRSIRPLIRLLDDNAQYDEAMFSIIHGAESFDDDVYASEILLELPYMVDKSPRWASILFMRALNSDAVRALMVKKIRLSPHNVKMAVLWLSQKINERSPKFLEKTLAVMTAAK